MTSGRLGGFDEPPRFSEDFKRQKAYVRNETIIAHIRLSDGTELARLNPIDRIGPYAANWGDFLRSRFYWTFPSILEFYQGH
jgi:hypothetical protein